MEALRELVHQVLRARVAMRLKDREDTPEIAKLRGGQRGANFGGVVAVIVDHRDAAGLAAHLETAIDAGVAGDGLADRIERDVQFQADGDSGRRVQHVVNAGHAQMKLPQIAAARPHREAAFECAAIDIGDLQRRPAGSGHK